jgi:hypothetical protein
MRGWQGEAVIVRIIRSIFFSTLLEKPLVAPSPAFGLLFALLLNFMNMFQLCIRRDGTAEEPLIAFFYIPFGG